MKRMVSLIALPMLLFAGLGNAQAQRLRAANGGFGNAILPGAYHAKIFQKYGLVAEYIALESGTIGSQTLLAEKTTVDQACGRSTARTTMAGLCSIRTVTILNRCAGKQSN